MATCKDCVHYAKCYLIEHYGADEEEICEDFVNKVDFVEVVRCKDCIYYESNCCFNRQWDLESSIEVPLVRENDYCSYGERERHNG